MTKINYNLKTFKNRRNGLYNKLIVFLMVFSFLAPASHGFSISRDLDISISVNQLGYPREAQKKCVLLSGNQENFAVIRLKTGATAYRGKFQSRNGDFGNYKIGDFSSVTLPGKYYIKAGNGRSYPFTIRNNIYLEPLKATLNYLQVQRCGRSTTGYLSPCHLDDGVRMDNGKHMDGTCGWHDACDIRKEVSGTIYGMLGLAKFYDVVTEHSLKSQILDELLWGNHYFLNMQEPEGFVMKGTGPSVLEHADNNRWTDNKIGKFGGELHLVTPDTGRSTDTASIIGKKDDRVVNTDPASDVIQFNFVYAEALLADILQHREDDYSQDCLSAAKKCFAWCIENDIADNINDYGALVRSALQLYVTTNQEEYRDLAIEYADKIMALQIDKIEHSPVYGFFKVTASKNNFRMGGWKGDLPFNSLCLMTEILPEHQNAKKWKSAISNYIDGYLKVITGRNVFGFVPFGIFNDEKPVGNRKIGDYWYRYFVPVRELEEGQGESFWRVKAFFAGTNSNTISVAIGLARAARILRDPSLKDLAQDQIDWLFGLNPVQASSMEGFGADVLEYFVNVNEYYPVTPKIKGGVMNGIAGTKEDQPVRHDQSWQTSEYWIPHVGHAMWLFSELQK